MKKYLLFIMILLSLKCVSQNHWVPNYHQFPMNMCVIAVLDINGIEQQTEYLELGVFTGDECRGSCILHYYDAPVNRYLLFLTTYGNNGDPYTFKLYDHLTQQELDLSSSNEMSFYANDIIGAVSNPYVFSFTGGQCSVSTVMDPPGLGEVTGGGEFLCGTYCTVTANPFDNHLFLGWMLEGDTLTTENSFSWNAVTDVELKACFLEVLPVYTVSVTASPEEGGEVSGAGQYEQGMTCLVTAVASEGFQFEHWMEGEEQVSEAPSFSFEVEGDRNLVAVFREIVAPVVYQIELHLEPAEGGAVFGAGMYEEGSLCTVAIALSEHYEFVNWTENGIEVSTESSYSFVVDADRSLVANVEYVNALSEVEGGGVLYPNPTSGIVWLTDSSTAEVEPMDVIVYDATGRQMFSSTASVLDFSNLADGVYYVRFTNGKVSKVVLRR
jgi:hypothetical protein